MRCGSIDAARKKYEGHAVGHIDLHDARESRAGHVHDRATHDRRDEQ